MIPRSTFVVLFVSVVAMSWAAPLVRFTDAPAAVVAFWRLALSLPMIGAILVARGEWGSLRRLNGREWAVAALAGVLLGAHFASWVASVTMTSVAASVALVSTQPVWVALFGIVALREFPLPWQWLGIAVAVAGAAVIGWGDLDQGGNAVAGDALALSGALLVAGYFVIGRRLRREVGLWPYVAIVYGFATGALFLAIVVATDLPVAGPYGIGDWLVFLGLALGPMLIGHTGQNWALRYLPAHTVNLTLLGEPVGATLIAWWLPAIAEPPAPVTVVGGLLILTGIAVGLRRSRNG